MTPTLRTYCTGGDLFGHGAAQAGYRVVDGFEIDPKKAAVARQNGHHVHVADVTTLDQGVLAPVDHEHTSPSCKTASQANSDGGETPDDIAVAQAMCRAIRAHAARGGRSWSLENVWGYRNFANCFPPILQALTEAGFVWEFSHVNMADFGVPQTRKRLILRAVHRRWRDRVPPLHPTHRRGGDMFSPPWVGWYEAIADLIPTLPETTPAPWQLQRLGRLPAATTLVERQGAGNRPLVTRAPHEPSRTVRGAPRGEEAAIAYLVNGQNAGDAWGKGYREDAESMYTVAYGKGGYPVALLVGGGNTNLTDPTSLPRTPDQPAFTVRDGRNGSPERALLLGDQSGAGGEGVIRGVLVAPAMTVRAYQKAYRAYEAGRWVRITLACLARFQTVPDNYIGLTAEINGNGVPPLFSQRLMESLL